MTQAHLTNTAPILLVADVIKSADYYRDQLGFTDVRLYNEPPNFCIATRDNCKVMLAQTPHTAGIVPNWKIHGATSNIYFWVDDIETLYAEYQARDVEIDFTLYTTPWGMKEFGVQDVDGYDITFGQIIGG